MKDQALLLNKWKKAVIHIEGAADSESWRDTHKQWIELSEKHKKGEISVEELFKSIHKTRDLRYLGTAIFLKNNTNYYLITARHVLHDKMEAKRELEEELRSIESWPEQMRGNLSQSAYDKANNRIFNILFRVPTLDEILSNNDIDRKFLMNLGAGTTDMLPYTFSAPDIDLAIISLNQRDSEFAKELISIGKEPIEMTDIEPQPSAEGTKVFTVGFPSATALLGQVNLDQARANWASNNVSLPSFAFGNVAMLHDKLNFFWTDMSIYPGNSGGPVIENDKLVGVVSAQPSLVIESTNDIDNPETRYRIPFGKIIKAHFIDDLLQAQIKKDQFLPKLQNQVNSIKRTLK